MVALQSESPILVWEFGGCVPEETRFILQGEVTLAAISSFLEMSKTEMSSLRNGCPALLQPVLLVLSRGETFCPTPGTPGRGHSSCCFRTLGINAELQHSTGAAYSVTCAGHCPG